GPSATTEEMEGRGDVFLEWLRTAGSARRNVGRSATAHWQSASPTQVASELTASGGRALRVVPESTLFPLSPGKGGEGNRTARKPLIDSPFPVSGKGPGVRVCCVTFVGGFSDTSTEAASRLGD